MSFSSEISRKIKGSNKKKHLRYRDVVRRLIICHDQMVQPQKRESIKYVLDCAIGRMLEYNREIVGLESNDYQYLSLPFINFS